MPDGSIREAVGFKTGQGPSEAEIQLAVNEFAGQFEYWYTRVIAKAVPKYRSLIVKRINALVRPVEFDGLSVAQVGARLVSDYVNRNFVTAGGWAIERMAIALASAAGGAKASSRGIDLERTDEQGNRHLYVIKSGTVTRNSDILSKLKQHARDAEKLIRQGGSKVAVFANYVVAAGATSSSFEDGINRPSSGEFWSEITGLSQTDALLLVSEIAKAAGALVTRDSDAHVGALVTLVQCYIEDRKHVGQVDWPFIFKLTMTERDTWKAEDAERHGHALASLEATGYRLDALATSKRTKPLVRKGKAARTAGENGTL